MGRRITTTLAVCAALAFGGEVHAQQALYGSPGVNLDTAKKAIAGAMAEAKKNNWNMAIAVVSNGGNLVAFEKMDNTMIGSIKIAQHKAAAAAQFKRPTKAFVDAIAASPANVGLVTLDGIIISEGGYPLMNGEGKIIGAIGCSGATGAQDGQACQAGVAALK